LQKIFAARLLIEPPIDAIEPPIEPVKASFNAAEPFVHLIEGALDVGYTCLERMCVHRISRSKYTSAYNHAPSAGERGAPRFDG
jgi:hypothetical protein